MASTRRVNIKPEPNEVILDIRFEALKETFADAVEAGLVPSTREGFQTFVSIMTSPSNKVMGLIHKEIEKL